ncbi:AAA family ATPase [Xenorhabdus sp. ZM]|uniref:AAA family ATPase n=1 Tax=Xenorhabdus szentirmaii TaxID=290112 RepID=UPI0019A18BED|nr:AAA family ATPase [Xenorhabdus sp. ZM]MBD2803152.1 AAA family ATPase [Xenorhabdus sp. ZM]
MSSVPLTIKGFKSIAELSITDENSPFIAFAGSNGAGKSNITDALAFFGAVVKIGATQAIRDFGGFQHIHCYKLRGKNRATAELRLVVTISQQQFDYLLTIAEMDKKPVITEQLSVNGAVVIERKQSDKVNIVLKPGAEFTKLPAYSSDMTALMLLGESPFYQYITNIEVLRIEPLSAKKANNSSADTTYLDTHGSNIASVLSTLEKDIEFKEQILDWMELIVPGMESVSTEKKKLDGATVLTFKEIGTANPFPANLISDGTIYVLCIMTAILSRASKPGMTIIEEPERGIHPKAIGELVQLMRDTASLEHPIIITTHSESVVRNLEPKELWLVSKNDGKTLLKHASDSGVDKKLIPLDTAWLTNLFDGGLPW